MKEVIREIKKGLEKQRDNFSFCGIIDKSGWIYPHGTDTKVISVAFELVCNPIIFEVAKSLNYQVITPKSQNYYPDYTLCKNPNSKAKNKIAIDVKSSYRKNNSTFSYTLGSFTSYIRTEKESKNIVYPFSQYEEHWIIGFIYDRKTILNTNQKHRYKMEKLNDITVPYENVDFFIQKKWRIASDKTGSGNTTNIGSIKGTIEEFIEGNGTFESEDEFLEYWRNYEPDKKKREKKYSSIYDFREFRNQIYSY